MDTDLKYIYWSQIFDNMDMVMGIRNVYEIKEVISTRDPSLHFPSRYIPLPNDRDTLKPREQRFIKKMYVPFIDEISGLVIIKLVDFQTDCTTMIKV